MMPFTSTIHHYLPITDPTWTFFVVLMIILFAPIVMGKLRIPHIVGMVLAGVLVGKYGLNLLERDASFELFGKVGLYYILFLAALEMDIEGMKKNVSRFLIFGLLTFLFPFILTFYTSLYLLGCNTIASLLLSCIMSSHTLIAYPVVSRFGLQRKPAVTLTVGSTMISLLLALLVLATIVSSSNGTSDVWFWGFFLLKFIVFCAGIIFFIPRLARWFLRSYSDSVMQFIFVMAVMFLSAALSQAIGLEGIFGAFLAGLILNRYIPGVSPLMNRLEFIGNALFIPYFLISVGMLINISILYHEPFVIAITASLVFFGTLGKAMAAWLASKVFKLPKHSATMMFGLSSAHAAGSIAMLLVGLNIVMPNSSEPVVTNSVLNGVVIMILITCVFASIVTQSVSKKMMMSDTDSHWEEDKEEDDERILIPVKYPETAENLLALALLLRSKKLNRELMALNVVYDDADISVNQARGKRLLDKLSKDASAVDVNVITQVRVAANIANGIKHAYQEFRASEIIIGMHTHREVSEKFWGAFHQSLFNGLNCQIIMARIEHPLNTLRTIQVAVPSRAQYEPGFKRWLERLTRMAEHLDCKIQFHARYDTLERITRYNQKHHAHLRVEYKDMPHWNMMPRLASSIHEDNLFVIITARTGTVSYKNAQERLPEEIETHFRGKNLLIVFPDQYGYELDQMTFAQPKHIEEQSAYEAVGKWIRRKLT